MRVLVTGASGLIGSAVAAALEARGDTVVALGRSSTPVSWNPAAGTISGSLEGIDAVVHLAGESIGKGRWNAAKKQRIVDSRVKGTKLLVRTVAALEHKPSVFVSSSAIGFYGNRGREELLDETSTPGDDFLADVCKQWEAAAQPITEAGIRLAVIRTGIVLTPSGGALKQMLVPFKLGVGGKLGPGRQYMSWITLADEVRAILHIIDNAEVEGVVNLTAPHPVTNEVFTKILAEVLHRPGKIPAPSFALKALLGGELAEGLLLHGQRVFPKKLEATGFEFESRSEERRVGKECRSRWSPYH